MVGVNNTRVMWLVDMLHTESRETAFNTVLCRLLSPRYRLNERIKEARLEGQVDNNSEPNTFCQRSYLL